MKIKTLAVGLIALLSPVLVQATELRVGVPEKSAPLASIENGQVSGLIGEAASSILKGMGFTLKPVEQPFARIYSEIQSGALDVAVRVLGSEERRKQAFYSDPIVKEYQVLVVPKGSDLKFEKISDLAGKRIGTQRGFIYPTLDGGPATLEPGDNTIQNVSKLLAGRLDAVIVNSIFGVNQVAEAGHMDKVEILKVAAAEVPLGIALSFNKFKENDLAAFNKALAAYLQSPEWKSLQNKYGLDRLVKDYPLAAK